MKCHNFKPHESHTISLNDAAAKLEVLLEDFIKNIKGYKEVRLIVKSPTAFAADPLGSDWYINYPRVVKDCVLLLHISVKGGILTKAMTHTYAKAKITELPACCGVCVINGVELHPDIRGNGIGKGFISVVEAFAKVLNYSYVMCTTHKVNGPAIGIVECLGYTELDNGFVNMRTKNSVRMFGKNINPDGVALTDGYLNLKET